MKSVAAVFASPGDALVAVDRLTTRGIRRDSINLLVPEASVRELETVPTTAAERPGMGKAIGALVGGVSGMALGPIGAAFASVVVPGIGPVLASGLIASAVLGASGAVAGAAAGGALERATSEGLPKDELFVYEDALRQGRTVLIVAAENDDQAESARQIALASGAETIDAARHAWWIGLRDAEEEHYRTFGRDFAADEEIYRLGFEAAQHPDLRGLSYDEVRNELSWRYPGVFARDAFRAGYIRGKEHRRKMRDGAPE